MMYTSKWEEVHGLAIHTDILDMKLLFSVFFLCLPCNLLFIVSLRQKLKTVIECKVNKIKSYAFIIIILAICLLWFVILSLFVYYFTC